jgi:hypothetical protein
MRLVFRTTFAEPRKFFSRNPFYVVHTVSLLHLLLAASQLIVRKKLCCLASLRTPVNPENSQFTMNNSQ